MDIKLFFLIWLSISLPFLFGRLVLCKSLDLPFVVYQFQNTISSWSRRSVTKPKQ